MPLYDTSINDVLRCYYEKAKLEPPECRERSRRGIASRSPSSFFAEYQEILGNIEQEYRVKISELSDQLVDAATSAEVAKEKRRSLLNHITRMTQEKKKDKEGKKTIAEYAESCC